MDISLISKIKGSQDLVSPQNAMQGRRSLKEKVLGTLETTL